MAASCGWVDGGAAKYDCIDVPGWAHACQGPHTRYSPMQPALRDARYVPCDVAWPTRFNASRALELLANRTVAVVGDSLANNLFCALTCALVRDGTATFGALAPGPVAHTSAVRIADHLHSSSWVLPTCAGGRHGRCIYGHGTLGAACGVHALEHLADKAESGMQLVVLHNPCAAHANVGLDLLHARVANASLQDFAAWERLMPDARSCRGEGVGADAEPTDHAHCTAAAADGAGGDDVVEAYAQKARTAAAWLARISGADGSLGLLIESMPAHNPPLGGCLRAAAAGLGARAAAALDSSEFEGLVLSLAEFARQLARSESGAELLGRLGIDRPGTLLKGTMHLTRLLAAGRAIEARCVRGRSDGNERTTLGDSATSWCAGAEGDSAHSPRREPLAALLDDSHVRACAHRVVPRLGAPSLGRTPWRGAFHPGWCAPRASPLTDAVGWRQQAERAAVAGAAPVGLLARSAAREPRWDVHPGVQRPSPGFFDCKHSSLAPGAFDVEALGFLRALERRFGGGYGPETSEMPVL